MNESPLRLRHAARLDKAHPFRQWKTWTLPGTRFTLTGYSRSNDKTFFHLPDRLPLDRNRLPVIRRLR